MPIYEFVCSDCKQGFEVLTTSSSEATPSCPKCESNHVERVLSVVSIGREQPAMSEDLSGCATCPGRGMDGTCPRE